MTTPRITSDRLARPRPLAVLLLVLLAGVLASVGCGPSKIQKEQSLFDRPLATLADSGQVEAMRVVADIEVLRAQGMFTDSLANWLTELPASEYMSLDKKGVLTRVSRGIDLSKLVDYLAVEPQLVNELVVTAAQAAELRRLAMENMAAAAEMATDFVGQRPETPK